MARPVVAITTPLEAGLVDQIRVAFGGRIDLRYRPDLMPAPRYVADHGDPAFVRTPEQSRAWREMLADAEITFDFATDGDAGPLQLCPKLKWIQTTSAGVGPAAKSFGLGDSKVIVTTASGIHAGPLAEFVFAALLYWVKEIPRLLEDKSAHRWMRFCAGELRGRTLAVVGPGRIGSEVARIGKAFGMNVWVMGRSSTPDRADTLGVDRVWDRAELRTMLAGADAVVLVVPHTPETVGMIGPDEIAAMKPGTMLVNIARGVVIDELALLAALQSGQIGFAALDVFTTEPLPTESPFWDLPNVLINPHSASTAWGENARLTDRFIANLDHYLAGELDRLSPRLDIERGY